MKKHSDLNVGEAKASGRTIYIISICNNDVILCFNQTRKVSDAWDIFIGFGFNSFFFCSLSTSTFFFYLLV